MFQNIFSHYFSVDIDLNQIEHNDNSAFLNNVDTFVEDKLQNLYHSDSNRHYLVKDGTTQVISNINQMLQVREGDESQRIVHAESIARRLLNKEKEVQERITHLEQDVQKGGLIITCFDKDDIRYFAIVKIHYIDFYEEETFEEHRGLPKKNVILKTSICTVSNSNVSNDFYLSDSTKPKGMGAAKFWWDDFLELSPLINDAENTKRVFNQVDDLLKKEFYKDNREDYWFFRNNLVSFLRTEEYFVFNTMIERTLGNLDIDLLQDKSDAEKNVFRSTLTQKIQSVRMKNDQPLFDTEFTIDKKEVKAKIKRNITLLDNVELSIKGEISDFKTSIFAEKEGNRKFLKIYTDSGYDAFKSS